MARAVLSKQMHTGTQTNFYERGRGKMMATRYMIIPSEYLSLLGTIRGVAGTIKAGLRLSRSRSGQRSNRNCKI